MKTILIFVLFITHSVISQNSHNALKVTAPSSYGMRDEPVIVGATIFDEMKEEAWKDIPCFEGCYQVSNHGRVRSCARFVNHVHGKRKVRERIIKTQLTKCLPYPHVTLSKECKWYKFLVHRLTATAFLPEIEGKTHVNHKDGNKLNGHISNLEWVTQKENNYHARDTGLNTTFGAKGETSNKAILTKHDVIRIRNEYATGTVMQKELAVKYGVARATISLIISRKTWAHIP